MPLLKIFTDIIIVHTLLLLSMVPNTVQSPLCGLTHAYVSLTCRTDTITVPILQKSNWAPWPRLHSDADKQAPKPTLLSHCTVSLKNGHPPQHMQIYLFIIYIYNGYHLTNYAYFKTSKTIIRKDWKYRITNIFSSHKSPSLSSVNCTRENHCPQATNLNRFVLTTFPI